MFKFKLDAKRVPQTCTRGCLMLLDYWAVAKRCWVSSVDVDADVLWSSMFWVLGCGFLASGF